MNRAVFDFSYFMSARLALPLRFRMRIIGGPRDLDGPVLVLGKHVSYWDIPFVARGLRSRVRRIYPFFEMASFHGYRLLEKVIWFLELNGGFPVMRPKDLIRLKKGGVTDKDELRGIMKRVNEEAAATRRRVLEIGDAVCYFPEGTRDREKVLPLRSFHELEEALTFSSEAGKKVTILPVLPCYGRRKRGLLRRREARIVVLDPIEPAGRSAQEILAEAQELFDRHWLAPDQLDAQVS